MWDIFLKQDACHLKAHIVIYSLSAYIVEFAGLSRKHGHRLQRLANSSWTSL